MVESNVEWLRSIKASGVETVDNDIRLLQASISLSILHELEALNNFLVEHEVKNDVERP